MPRNTTTTSKANAATTFDKELAKLATSDADQVVAKALVEDLGTSLDKDPGEFPNLVAALRTIPKGEARTEMSGKVTFWYVTAAGASINMEHMQALTRAVTVAAAGSAPKQVGPTPEQLKADAIIRMVAARITCANVISQITADLGPEIAEQVEAANFDDIDDAGRETLSKLLDRAAYLSKPMAGRKGSTGPKAQIGRKLANLPEGSTWLFKDVEGVIKGDTIVVGEHTFQSPSSAACHVAKLQGAKNPSFNGWAAWKSTDGVSMGDVHAKLVVDETVTDEEPAEEVTTDVE